MLTKKDPTTSAIPSKKVCMLLNISIVLLETLDENTIAQTGKVYKSARVILAFFAEVVYS